MTDLAMATKGYDQRAFEVATAPGTHAQRARRLLRIYSEARRAGRETDVDELGHMVVLIAVESKTMLREGTALARRLVRLMPDRRHLTLLGKVLAVNGRKRESQKVLRRAARTKDRHRRDPLVDVLVDAAERDIVGGRG